MTTAFTNILAASRQQATPPRFVCMTTMGVGGNGWTPGQGGLGQATKGLNASMQAAKLAGRVGGDKARRRGSNSEGGQKKGSRRQADDDLDALLGGGSSAAPRPAEEDMPESRGLLGAGRRRGSRM